jgi:hypothetical protein
MNNGIYRLVFNKSRGLWMAVSEHVRSHQSGKSNGGKSKAKRNKRVAETASLFVILFGLGASSIVSIAFAAPRLPANTIPTNLALKAL